MSPPTTANPALRAGTALTRSNLVTRDLFLGDHFAA
jgi:hypothetical protein